MSKCKHETIGFWRDDDGRSIPYCTKCEAYGEQLVSELQQMIADRDATITSQERQLDAAADDSSKFVLHLNCPMKRFNGLRCETLDCKECWRKRWEEMSNEKL